MTNWNRRAFCREALPLAFGGGWILSTSIGPTRAGAADAAAARGPAQGARICDFQRSYMTWNLPPHKDPRPNARHNIPFGNKARIELDALIDVVESSGQSEQFVLIAACRAEWVYAADHLFQMPNREYRNIYSMKEQRSLGHGITDDGTRSVGRSLIGDFGRSLTIDVRHFKGCTPLTTPAEIVQATARNAPLVARTEIDDSKKNRRYVLEYPIRTMNFEPISNSFQVDTGPLLVPDLDSDAPRAIDRFEIAHVVYNRLDQAEFILRRPTPIQDANGKELCRVQHYSEVKVYPARNELFAAAGD
jgi:hypothetical protein